MFWFLPHCLLDCPERVGERPGSRTEGIQAASESQQLSPLAFAQRHAGISGEKTTTRLRHCVGSGILSTSQHKYLVRFMSIEIPRPGSTSGSQCSVNLPSPLNVAVSWQLNQQLHVSASTAQQPSTLAEPMWWRWRTLNADDLRDEEKEFEYGWRYAGKQNGWVHEGRYATQEIGDEYSSNMSNATRLALGQQFIYGGAGLMFAGPVGGVLGLLAGSILPIHLMRGIEKNKKQATREEEERQAELARKLALVTTPWFQVLDNDFVGRFLGERNMKEYLELVDATILPQPLASSAIGCYGAAQELWPLLTLQLREGAIRLEDGTQVLHVFSDPQRPARHADIQIGIPVRSLLADQSLSHHAPFGFQLMKGWLTECDSHHTCMPTAPLASSSNLKKAHPFIPTRLIDTSGVPNLRLVTREEITASQEHAYMTLSHRWGQSTASAQTTRGNLQKRRAGFPLASMPKTFRDAIDSVYLVQDDPVDVSRELLLMEQVYASAYCTLAASSATDADQGLFPHDGTSLPSNGRPTETDVIKVPSLNLYISNFPPSDFDQHVNESSPLNCRAWVLQERVLSSRTIHFFSESTTDSNAPTPQTHIYFSCGVSTRSSDFTTLHCLPGRDYFIQDPQFPARLYSSGIQRTTGFLQWLFEDYSRLGITDVRDRHKAILGLTTRIENSFLAGTAGHKIAIGGRYGVMNGVCLVRMLLWRRKGGSAGGKIDYPGDGDAMIKRPPSWSWMSYPGEIEFLFKMDDHVGGRKGEGDKKRAIRVSLYDDLFVLKDGRNLKVKLREVKGSLNYQLLGGSFDETCERAEYIISLSVESKRGSHVGKLWADEGRCVLPGLSEGNNITNKVVVLAHDVKEKVEKAGSMVWVLFLRGLPAVKDRYERVGVGRLRADVIYGYGESGFVE
ncbi:hypothetical protein V8F06_014399 [Rhypophila decipiens]